MCQHYSTLGWKALPNPAISKKRLQSSLKISRTSFYYFNSDIFRVSPNIWATFIRIFSPKKLLIVAQYGHADPRAENVHGQFKIYISRHFSEFKGGVESSRSRARSGIHPASAFEGRGRGICREADPVEQGEHPEERHEHGEEFREEISDANNFIEIMNFYQLASCFDPKVIESQ